MDRSSREKVNKEIWGLNYILNQMNLTHIYRTFHPIVPEYTFFLSTHRTFSRTEHILGHKTSFRKFKKIEIIPSIFSNHNGIKIKKKEKKTGKFTNIWKLKNTLLNNQWVKKVIQKGAGGSLETNKNENTTYQNLQDATKAVLGEYTAINTYKKKKGTSQITNFTHYGTRKRRTKPQISRKKKISTSRVEKQ